MNSVKTPKQPLFNVPPVTLALIVLLTAVHLIRLFVLSSDQDAQWVATLGFIPLRFKQLALHDPLAWLPVISYAALHFGWMHFFVNVTGLAAFGSATERTVGAVRYIAILISGIIAGIALHFILFSDTIVLIGGISAGVSALFPIIMAIIQHTRQQTGWHSLLPALFIWVVMNIVFGLTGVPGGNLSGQGPSILAVAWVAHLGGFMAGLIWLPILWPHYRFTFRGETS